MSLLVGRIFRGKSFVIIRIIRENRSTSFLLGRTNVVATIFFINRFLLRISSTTYVTRVTTLSNDRTTRVSYSPSKLRIPADFFSSLSFSSASLSLRISSRGIILERCRMLNLTTRQAGYPWTFAIRDGRYIYIYIVKEGQVYLFEWTGILPEQC